MRRRRLRVSLLFATVLVVTTVGAAGQPVSAQEPEETPVVFGQPLDEYLSNFPDAKRLSEGVYQLEPGRRLEFGGPDMGITAAPPWGCYVHYFCLWADSDFSPNWSREYFYYCRRYDLNGLDDKVSSMYNAQTGFTATFWDTDANIQGKLWPNSYLRNLRWDLAPDGGNWNDRIDAVQPC